MVQAACAPLAEGAATAELLRDAGIDAKAAIASLPREQALVGAIELPTRDDAEMRSIARMALARDFSPEGTDAQGDFQRFRRDGRERALLAAAPRARLDAVHAAFTGIDIARIGVRTLGMLALVRSNPAWRDGATIVVDAPRGSVEVSRYEGGELLHSRGTTLAPSSADAFAAQAAAEARRALATMRAAGASGASGASGSSGASAAPARVVVAAEPSVAAVLAEQLAGPAGCAIERLESHPLVDVPAGAAGDLLRSECWPLAGLLLEDALAAQRAGLAIDLAHPTPLIDVAARARQRALMVAGVVVVAALAGWTFGTRSWRALEDRRDDLKEKATGALPEVRRMKRDELKLAHIDAVRAMQPAWLEHFEVLRRFAPDPSTVVLDGLSAQLASGEVEYGRDGKFTARPEVRFVLDGEARDRETADALRDALVKEKSYTVSSSGADARGGRRLPYPFAYTVRTAELAPRPAGGKP